MKGRIYINKFCKKTGVLILAIISTLFSYSQPTLFKKVDSLFSAWNNKNIPGYVVGIIKRDRLIFSKGYGLANLEYDTPLTTQSPFYIGSMSKQFTAYCLLLLEQQGKLRLTDSINQYLPEMPVYEKPITIEHLLHHTSGIREYTSLLLFKGAQPFFEDPTSNDDVLRLLASQRSLNFNPGNQYNYSSGGYILLAKIIERISGVSLREFASQHLFSPLGMVHTFFNDNHAEIILGRVESYRPVDSGYNRFNKNFDMYGDGGIITTVEDLAKWDAAFYSDKLGLKNFASKMYKQGKLDNGSLVDYASALQVTSYKGRKSILHNGFMLGYSADMIRFPEDRFTVIVLSNSWKTPPTVMAYRIADFFLEPKAGKSDKKEHELTSVTHQRTDTHNLKKCVGNYWNRNKNYFVQLLYKNGALFYDDADGFQAQLITAAKDSFLVFGTDMSLYFNVSRQGNAAIEMRVWMPEANTKMEEFDKYDPTPPSNVNELKRYEGVYYNAELNTNYKFFIEEDKLFLQINDNTKQVIFPASGRIVWNSANMVWVGFGEIMFRENEKREVIGFSLGDARVKGVYFKKVNR